MSQIGLNTRVIRESLGISQAELAEKAGYKSQNFIVAIENGTSEPAYEKVKDIANALGVSIYQLRGSYQTRDVKDLDEIRYRKSDVIAMDLFSPILGVMEEEDIYKSLDYMLLILKAKGLSPNWKKPKYAKEEE